MPRPVLFYRNICLNEITFVISQFSTLTTPRALGIRKRIGVRCVTKHFYQTTVKKRNQHCVEYKSRQDILRELYELIFRNLWRSIITKGNNFDLKETACFNLLRNLPEIALLSVYAAAACEPNLKEFLHSFKELHTIGAVVFSSRHSSEAQDFFTHSYDIRENKRKFLFLSSLCFAPKMYDKPTLSPNFTLLLRTSDRAIILAVVSLSLSLSRLRAQHGSVYLSPTCLSNVSFHLLSLFQMRVSVVPPITNYLRRMRILSNTI